MIQKAIKFIWHLLPYCYTYVWVVTESTALLGFYTIVRGSREDLFYLPYDIPSSWEK